MDSSRHNYNFRLLEGISYIIRHIICLASEGYTHFSVNHSVKFVDPKTGAHTQNIERVWREVRGGVPRFGRNKQHFAGYLAEFLFKLHLHRAPTCVFVYGGRAVFASSAVVGLF